MAIIDAEPIRRRSAVPIHETKKSIRIRQTTKNFRRYATATNKNSKKFKWLPDGVAVLLGFNGKDDGDGTIKTIIFSKPKWNLKSAQAWCRRHNFNPNGV